MAEPRTVSIRLPEWARIGRHLPMWTRRLGGPSGTRRSRPSGAWAYLMATISWVVCLTHQLPCRQSVPTDNPDRFGWMCYTDLTALYFTRGQSTGGVPYGSVSWEYPVLTGYFATLANSIGQLFGANLSSSADGQQLLDNGNIYFAVSAVGLFACLIWLVASLLKLVPGAPGVVMAVAISPILMANSLINWDLLVVALTAAGLASWSQQRYRTAGLWWGLGVAAKLYPIVIIGALLILCLRPLMRYFGRAGEDRDSESVPRVLDWLQMVGVAAAVWLLANLPVMMSNFAGWKVFYTQNSVRGADLGSLWYALQLMGASSDWTAWSRALMIVCFLGLAALILLAKRPPTVVQIAYLAVAIMAMANVVYSPQYVLWMLPLLVLIRPVLLDVAVFTAAELFYFVWIWLYLKVWMSESSAGALDATRAVYIASILLRLAATWWLMGRVARDVLTGESPAPELATDEGPRMRWLRHRPEHAWGITPKPLAAASAQPVRKPRLGQSRWSVTASGPGELGTVPDDRPRAKARDLGTAPDDREPAE